MRTLLRLPVRAVQAIALVALAGVLVFVGLTRTQVGRDGLRAQLEAGFDAQFEGRLSIGRLSGNLVSDLYATDVRLFDPQGRLVLAADSVVVEPTWTGLLRRQFVVDEAVLFRPRLALVRGVDGRWNLAEAFAPRRPRTEPGRPFDFVAPEVRLVDGHVMTRNEGTAPDLVRSGTLFDYTDALLTDLDAQVRVRWGREKRRLQILNVSGRLPRQRLLVEQLDGDLAFTEGQVTIDDVLLVTDESRIDGSFARTAAGNAPAAYRLDLARSTVSGEELRRIVPALPLADAVELEVSLEGPRDALRVEHLRIARGESYLEATGRLADTADAFRFAVAVDDADVRATDVAAIVPSLDLSMLRRLRRVSGRIDADGTLVDGRFRAEAAGRIASGAGRLRGSGAVRLGPDTPLAVTLDATVGGLDLGRILDNPRLRGDLNGRIDGRLEDRAGGFGGEVALDLGPSTLAGRTFDALDAALTFAPEDGALRIGGRAALTAAGRLALAGSAALPTMPGSPAVLDFDADFDSFDLRRLAPTAPASDLSATVSLSGTGAALDAFDGTLDIAFAPSTLTLGGTARPVAAHDATLRIRPAGTDVPRFDLDGDLLAARVRGDVTTGAFAALAVQWADAFARTIADQRAHRLYTDSTAALPAISAPVDAPPQTVALTAEVRDPEALRALLPGFPTLAPGTALDARARLAPDALSLQGRITGDSLGIGTVGSEAFRGTVDLRSTFGATLLGRTTLDLDLRSDTLYVPAGPLADAAVTVRLRDALADVAARGTRGDGGGYVFAADLALLPDRTEVTVREARAAIGEQTWTLRPSEPVALYADAIVVPRLAFERVEDAATAPRLQLEGVVSARPADSLHVEASALDLGELLTLGRKTPPGGRLDAAFTVAAVIGQPTVVGEARVAPLYFDGRRAGDATLTSRYDPATDALAVDFRLRPTAHPDAVRNDLRATGTVRLPGTRPDGTRDRGALDLALDIDRLDLFLFDWLFPTVVDDAAGYAVGTGRITGVPRVPLFDADLHVRDGRFRVPAFGLALEAEGRVTVDREGFHIPGARLSDATGGQGLVRGDILFNDYRYFSLDLQADLAEVEIIDVPQSRDLPFYGNIRATGSATLTGPLDNVFLRAPNAQTTPDSEIFIPVTASGPAADAGFLVFADSLGNVPEFEERRSLIAERPGDERSFLDGLEMNLNVFAPPGSTVHLVFDPSVGDVITAVGSARLQLGIREGEFVTFGTFDVARGDYLFTAGDVFTRRFRLEEGGTLRWDGDPINARIDLPATYRTRASLAGLDLPGVNGRQRVPLVIGLDVEGRVLSPLVDLSIALDEQNRTVAGGEALRRQLNEGDRQAEYATSVLLTNSFLLAPSENPTAIREAADELFFTSLSQLVSSRLNLFLNDALGSENVDVLFGVQQGATTEDFDLTYGVALRLLDERLIIRGEGLYQRLSDRPVSEELQGEVAVEVRLGPEVSLEVFYRREGDVLLGSGLSATPYGAYGAGVNYETNFATWDALLRRIIGEAAEERDEAASTAP